MLPFLPFPPPISPGGLPLTFIIVRRLGKRSGVFWWFKTMSSLVPQLPKNATTKKHQLHLCRHKICSKYTLAAHNQQAHYPCHAPHLTGFSFCFLTACPLWSTGSSVFPCWHSLSSIGDIFTYLYYTMFQTTQPIYYLCVHQKSATFFDKQRVQGYQI